MNPAIDFFINYTSDNIRKTKEVLDHLNLLEEYAEDGGFTAAEFSDLARVVQEKTMASQISRRFILCLIPNEPVSGTFNFTFFWFILKLN